MTGPASIRRALRDRLRSFDLDAAAEAEAVEELAQHLEALRADALAAGATEEEAARAVGAELDDPEALAPLVATIRRSRRGRAAAPPVPGADGPTPRFGGDLAREIRFGLRAIARRPVIAGAAIVTLALAVGAVTAVFGLVDAVLLRPLPYAAPERLVHFFETKPEDATFSRREASWPDFVDLSERAEGLESVAGYDQGRATLAVGDGPPERVDVARVTDGFFAALGVGAPHGRTFLPGESGAGAARVALVTDGAWRRRFGADPGALGRTVRIDGEPFTLVGILPRGFEFPLAGAAELWLPLDVDEATAAARHRHWLDVVARLRPGTTLAQAEEQLGRVMAHIAEVDPERHGGIGVSLVPLREEITGGVRPAILLTFGAVSFLLLVACSNVASLLLARATEREHEFAVRSALGARPGRLLRQLFVESLLLAGFGGALGLALAWGGSRLAVAALPARIATRLPHLAEFSLHGGALALTLGLVVATTLLFGLAPALRAARARPADSMRRGRGAVSASRHRLGRALVVGEIAATLVLLLGSGLLVKSLGRLLDTSPGFRTDGLLTLRLAQPPEAGARDADLLRRHAELLERVGRLPGVTGVATVSRLPLDGGGDTVIPTLEVRPDEDGPEANIRGISAEYFGTLGIPLLSGRVFAESDRPEAPVALVVNRTFERRAFGGASAVGRRLTFGFLPGRPWLEIVGVVEDERVASLAADVTPVIYYHFGQTPQDRYSLIVRAADDPARLARSVRGAILEVDPAWPVEAVRTMSEVIDASPPVFTRRAVSRLLVAFALVAAVLAAVGIYGLIAFTVAQRRREYGVRLTLGAAPGEIARLVLGEGARLAGAGLALGLVLGLVASRLVSSLLYGVSPADPAVLVGASATVTLAALAACAVPALRASRLDPVDELRAE